MRNALIVLMLVPAATGCRNLVVGTRILGPVETRLDIPPVSPTAGGVRPVVVQHGAPSVALIDVDGLILNTPFVGPMSVGENPVALFREKLDAAAADPCIKAVVLRVNSPGGGVSACISMRRDLERFRHRTGLPIVACLMDTATGGAYYLASACDQVVAGPATVTGGIGVLLNLFNLRELMGQFNILPQPIRAGEFTDIGTSARALTEGEKAILQAMADEFHQQLIADVKRSRPAVKNNNAFDGRIFTGAQAKAIGLVDHIGDLDDALGLAAGTGGAAGARPGVVMYRRVNDPARSVYAVTANVPLQASLLPSLPGLDRSKLPTFLSAWQPDVTIEKLGGK